MGMLDYLYERKQVKQPLSHPFVNASRNFKELYCFGVGILCLGHMNAILETEDFFYELLSKLMLDHSFRDQVILDINHNLEYRTDLVLQALDTKEKQYCFILDLLLAKNQMNVSASYGQEIINGFFQVFCFSGKEKDFFLSFMHYAKNLQIQEAISSCQLFETENHIIPYGFLKYAFPELEMTTTYHGLSLVHGEHLVIDRNCVVHGDILLANGSCLELQDSILIIHGGIQINNGTLRAFRSEISIEQCQKKYFIDCHNSSGLEFDHFQIRGNSSCGFLIMDSGSLSIKDSQIELFGEVPALSFSGDLLQIQNSTFRECQNGAVLITRRASASIEESAFENCFSDYGGAVFADSLRDVTMTGNLFSGCRARYLGACVYFKNKKYGQKVKDSVLSHCTPGDTAVFNAYPSVNNTIKK